MSTAQMPRVANWLLRRLACGPRRESLIGDLDEQFARGRSSWWYWRQMLSAIVAGVATDLREQPWLAVRSVVLTSAVVVLWVESTWALYLWASVPLYINAAVVLVGMPMCAMLGGLWGADDVPVRQRPR